MMKKIFTMAALAFLMTACSNDIDEPQAQQQPANSDGMITITAKLAPKSEAGTRAVAPGTDSNGKDIIKVKWAVDEHLAILYEVNSTKCEADARISYVDEHTGIATIEFDVQAGTADDTPCTIVYPKSAAKEDHSGVKDAATLLARQDGTLKDDLDVRVGAGTIIATTPNLIVTTQPAAQFAIVKFSLTDGTNALAATQFIIKDGSNNVLTTVTPSPAASSTLYVAMAPATASAFKFEATAGSSTYTYTKSNATLTAGKYYQSPLTLTLIDMLHTPLTLEVLSVDNGTTITVANAPASMMYSKNGVDQGAVPASIDVAIGDKVAFYCSGVTTYFTNDGTDNDTRFGGTAEVKMYGNIMSLLYADFADKTALPADWTFVDLFKGFTTLKDASDLLLPATTLRYRCYESMFSGCSNLTAAPAELPATSLTDASKCYESMFSDCSNLTTVPAELPAMELSSCCYQQMFEGCSSLTTAPRLPATALENGCYWLMFKNCTSLTATPKLPATTLKYDCYDSMFEGCTSLTTAYVMAAYDFSNCGGMFSGCTKTGGTFYSVDAATANTWITTFNGFYTTSLKDWTGAVYPTE